MLAGEIPVSLIKGECQCPGAPRGDLSSLATQSQDTTCISKSRTYYVQLPCAPQLTCCAWSIRPKMGLSGHTKIAFVRGLVASAC
jgi:hypothetical protein